MNNEERITRLEEYMIFWQEAHNELIVLHNADVEAMIIMNDDILALRLKIVKMEAKC